MELCTVSVTFACRRTVWLRLKLSHVPTTPVVTSRIIGPTTTQMVGLINNFCIETSLVV